MPLWKIHHPVGAAMVGLDRGEAITVPSLPSLKVLEKMELFRKES